MGESEYAFQIKAGPFYDRYYEILNAILCADYTLGDIPFDDSYKDHYKDIEEMAHELIGMIMSLSRENNDLKKLVEKLDARVHELERESS